MACSRITEPVSLCAKTPHLDIDAFHEAVAQLPDVYASCIVQEGLSSLRPASASS